MNNSVYLIGRVIKKDRIKEYANATNKLTFHIKVEDNIIPILIESTHEYIIGIDKSIYKGSLIGIRGKIAEIGAKLIVKADKITDLNNYDNKKDTCYSQ